MMGLLDWFKQKSVASAEPVRERWVVLDVETSGLDPQKAQLLAVACIGLRVDWTTRTLAITPGDSFEIVIQPERTVEDKDNILIHGIGMQRQQMGLPGWQALPMLRDFLADAPLLAFHAWFDQIMLDRHFLSELGKPLKNPWLDIEKLCAVTQPDAKAEDLDQWLNHFNLTCPARHEAAADAFVEAEVLQCIWPQLMKEMGSSPSWQGLKRVEKLDQWLSR
ncbi:3'-5' exonuclease [Variovorax sp. PCZ-1]|uniref:3'-5' exonuclease n=1 Tax=Variovorax sp. PCZ-1 TaxID=2835533 RepID=UPI001BCCF935|nr:3'-5' exonuclease [Variovorax sp. PCZ-1]MBS7806729.1 3'-5' exonuclease [Variovorax sp. PCZ-1]